MATYKLRPRARDDLRSIRRWIAKDNPARARTFIVELTEHFQKIVDLRLRHPIITSLGSDIRRAVHGNYSIDYRSIGVAGEDVLIVRVLHSARDLNRMKFD